jgi:hypothetical protein
MRVTQRTDRTNVRVQPLFAMVFTLDEEYRAVENINIARG